MTKTYDNHHRRSIRLKGYDYTRAGMYFVTICAWQKTCLFGEIVNDAMVLNAYGEIVESCWHELPEHYQNVELDEMVVMPNHVHGIIVITDVGAGLKPAPTKGEPAPASTNAPPKQHGLSEFVRALKTFSARKINVLRNNPGCPVWQRNYYERIIRNEKELDETRMYIMNNPLKWVLDDEYAGTGNEPVGAGLKPAPTKGEPAPAKDQYNDRNQNNDN